MIYRQEAASQIDFPALGDALNSLKLGTVDLKRLSQKHGDTEFLSDLISQEMKGSKAKDRPDALIFAGEAPVGIAELRRAFESFLPKLMEGQT